MPFVAAVSKGQVVVMVGAERPIQEEIENAKTLHRPTKLKLSITITQKKKVEEAVRGRYILVHCVKKG